MKIKILDGANLDIDLVSGNKTSWKQMKCPWNEADGANSHKCAVKNVSICKYFCGIEYLDNVLCCYPHKNTSVDNKQKKVNTGAWHQYRKKIDFFVKKCYL